MSIDPYLPPGCTNRDIDAAGLDGPLDRPARQAPKGLQFRADDKPDETEVDDGK
jgi:hypothetical protein